MSIDEKVYFEKGNVKVTSARFIVPGETYAMSGITSVKGEAKSYTVAAIGLGILGALVALSSWEIGAVMIGLAVLAFFLSSHSVFLRTASGEAQALKSRDKEFINQIIDALNQAIVERG